MRAPSSELLLSSVVTLLMAVTVEGCHVADSVLHAFSIHGHGIGQCDVAYTDTVDIEFNDVTLSTFDEVVVDRTQHNTYLSVGRLWWR